MNLTLPKHSDLKWSFNSDKPYIALDMGEESSNEYVDPFPCYAHEEELARSEIARIENALPLPFAAHWFVMPFESTSRTNGYANANDYYAERGPVPYIVLHGKRIPPMPSMTRYLLSHEYGHLVDAAVQRLSKVKNEESDAAYAKMRNIEYVKEYGALSWHRNTGEVIANDIRIVLLGAEPEFWPHPYPHPLKCPEVVAYWNDIKAKHFSRDISSLDIPSKA